MSQRSVYTVEYAWYEEYHFYGVFSSHAKAEEAVWAVCNRYSRTGHAFRRQNSEDWVEEWQDPCSGDVQQVGALHIRKMPLNEIRY